MSEVNNAMLSFGGLESEAARMAEVNDALADETLREQTFADNTCYKAAEIGWGGYKWPEKLVWAGAFNHVSFETVMDAVRGANWESPDEVQVLWCGQHDDLWTVHTL